jgi:hypothetical protein
MCAGSYLIGSDWRTIVGGADRIAPPLDQPGWRITSTPPPVNTSNMPTDSVTPFFANESNRNALRNLISRLPAASTQEARTPDVAQHLKQILQVMVSDPIRFDELCPQNIKWIGSQFLSAVQNYEEGGGKPDSNATIFSRWHIDFSARLNFQCQKI